MAERKVKSPDGREWTVRSSGRVFPPPWRAVALHSSERISEAPFLNRLIGDIVIGALIFPLIVWLLELPIALLRSFIPRKRWLEARDNSSPQATMKWELTGKDGGAAVKEVARQLEAGSQGIQVENAVYLGAG